MITTSLVEELRRRGFAAEENLPIGARTTYRVGGAARVGVTLGVDSDFEVLASILHASGSERLVVGNGSNMLIADRGFPGVAILLGEGFDRVVVDRGVVCAGGAVMLPVLARRTVAAGLGGLEWCVGVPGTVGGAVRMNAGGHGSDIAATLRRADVVDLDSGRRGWWSADDLKLGYRRSTVGPAHLVLQAEFELGAADREISENELADIVRWRRENQPGGQNAGSVFANPPGDSAGRLVEACGLKGRRVGTAAVSAKHANFIQADTGGLAADVAELMRVVRDAVHHETGVCLKPEVRLVGFEAEELAGLAGPCRGQPGS